MLISDLSPSLEDVVRARVAETGLVREEAVDWFVDAWRDGELHPRQIRKRGSALRSEEKKVYNITFKGILTLEYWTSLNEAGQQDPEIAAWKIAGPAMHAYSVARNVKNAVDAGIEHFQFRASNMQAGPCIMADRMNDQVLAADKLQVLPFESCSHPTQCACFYQSHLVIDT